MGEMIKPVIFITNDDGVDSLGIRELAKTARQWGDVVVVAPDRARSGMSSAITHSENMNLTKLSEEPGLAVYSCSGTPVDCVKLAFFALFEHKRPDLLLSGINHGSNSSVNAVYSGTIGAVLEGCINGISSIGFSLCDHEKDADFSAVLPFVSHLISWTLNNPLPKGICLNANFPKGAVNGIKPCRQADARWSEEYIKNKTSDGSSEYLLAGYFDNREPLATDTDEWALNHSFGSLVPIKIDMTDYEYLKFLNEKL